MINNRFPQFLPNVSPHDFLFPQNISSWQVEKGRIDPRTVPVFSEGHLEIGGFLVTLNRVCMAANWRIGGADFFARF